MRCLAKNKPKQWDLALSQAEFAYNRSKNQTTNMSSFEIVCGKNPYGVLDLVLIPQIGRVHPKAEEMTDHLRVIHDQVYKSISKNKGKYKGRVDSHRRQVMFKVGVLVWVVLTRDRFPVGDYRKIGPYEILQRINDNAYRLLLVPF